MQSEQMEKTANDKIFIERDAPITPEQLQEKLSALHSALAQEETDLRALMMRLVPTYHSPEEVNGKAMNA
jgi:hypothetical protein